MARAYGVKNVQAGYFSAGAFHPLRGSRDYDPDRASDDYEARTDAQGLKHSRYSKFKRKHTFKHGVAVNPRSRVYTPSSKKGVTSKRTKLRKLTARGKSAKARYLAARHGDTGVWGSLTNPSIGSVIPTKWAKAQVKRVGKQVQVMLFGGKRNPGSGIGVGDHVRMAQKYLDMLSPSVRRDVSRARYTVTMVEARGRSTMVRMVNDRGEEWRTPLGWLVPAGR